MKQLLLIAAVVLLSSHGILAEPDSSSMKDPEVFLFGGLSDPYLPKDFNDTWESGWNLGGGFGYSLAPGDLGYGSLFLSAEFARFSLNQNAFRKAMNLPSEGITILRNPTEFISFMVNFKGTFSPTRTTVAPYFLAGVGYMKASIGSVDVTNDNSGETVMTVEGQNSSGVAWTIGLGVEVPVNEMVGLFAQARSILGVVNPSRQYFPISGGIRYRL